MLGFSRETDITHGAACLGTEIVTGVELGSSSVCVACARSPCNGCMPRGYFQVPVSEARPTKFGSFGRDTERMILLLPWV